MSDLNIDFGPPKQPESIAGIKVGETARPKKRWLTWWQTGLVVGLVSAALACALIWLGSTFPDATPRRSIVGIGEVGKLYRPDLRDIQVFLVATDYDSFNSYVKAVAANDPEGEAELVAAGKLYRVAAGTKVRVLESHFTCKMVRILEGPAYGRAAWISNESVSGPDD
jgi:hypothetical protein